MIKRYVFVLCIAFACSVFACAALAGCAASAAGSSGPAGAAQIDLAYVKEHASSAKLLDVRDFTDYAGVLDDDADRKGHVPGAVNIPYANMLDKAGDPISDVRLKRMFNHANLAPEDEIIVYGEGADDAQAVAGLLAQCGYTQVAAWPEGYGAWMNDASNEVEKSSLSCCGA